MSYALRQCLDWCDWDAAACLYVCLGDYVTAYSYRIKALLEFAAKITDDAERTALLEANLQESAPHFWASAATTLA